MSEKKTSYLFLLYELLKKWRGAAESAPPPFTGRINQFVVITNVELISIQKLTL